MKAIRILSILAVCAFAVAVPDTVFADVVAGEPKPAPVAVADPDIPPPPRIAVPEPATFGLFSIGVAFAAGLCIRNRRSA